MTILRWNDVDDVTRVLTLDDGVAIELRVEGDSVGVYRSGAEIGRLYFLRCLEPAGHGEEMHYRLTHAFIEGEGGKYKRRGIGLAAVRFFLQCTGSPLSFAEDDGRPKSDGSHLVGDGPAFIASLKRKKSKGEL